ncbi:MAG: hypothetical protein HOV76_08125 [Hamadaea sp.]|nr:hypothetical protein [Hamadaea sp.]
MSVALVLAASRAPAAPWQVILFGLGFVGMGALGIWAVRTGADRRFYRGRYFAVLLGIALTVYGIVLAFGS